MYTRVETCNVRQPCGDVPAPQPLPHHHSVCVVCERVAEGGGGGGGNGKDSHKFLCVCSCELSVVRMRGEVEKKIEGKNRSISRAPRPRKGGGLFRTENILEGWWCVSCKRVAVCCSVTLCVSCKHRSRSLCSCIQSNAHGYVAETAAYKATHTDMCALIHVPRTTLQCIAVCCGVLQCVAVCCGVLQCVVVRCGVLRCVAV